MFCIPCHHDVIDLQAVNSYWQVILTLIQIYNFIQSVHLHRCDDLFPDQKTPTYINTALDQENQIDYILTSAASSVSNFQALDLGVNFSDHVPICLSVIKTNTGDTSKASDASPNHNNLL